MVTQDYFVPNHFFQALRKNRYFNGQYGLITNKKLYAAIITVPGPPKPGYLTTWYVYKAARSAGNGQTECCAMKALIAASSAERRCFTIGKGFNFSNVGCVDVRPIAS